MDKAAASLKQHLLTVLKELKATPKDELLERRYNRLMAYGN
jgi:acetyl-CoA carboxylase alpha subunit